MFIIYFAKTLSRDKKSSMLSKYIIVQSDNQINNVYEKLYLKRKMYALL